MQNISTVEVESDSDWGKNPYTHVFTQCVQVNSVEVQCHSLATFGAIIWLQTREKKSDDKRENKKERCNTQDWTSSSNGVNECKYIEVSLLSMRCFNSIVAFVVCILSMARERERESEKVWKVLHGSHRSDVAIRIYAYRTPVERMLIFQCMR